MPRFFVEPDKIREEQLVIDTEDVSHLKKVLRIREGEKITVCDSCGYDYEAEVETIGEREILCRVLSKKHSDTESNLTVTLYQALPKAAKMDYIIQKTTELGVCRIVPCALSRCVVKLENRKAEEKKTSRWQKIAEEAAKQSGRGVIPRIDMPQTLSEALEELKGMDLAFVPYECEDQTTLRAVLNSRKEVHSVGFLIGPEGGFDPAETEVIRNAGIPTVTLGKRILRTETAGEAVLAMVMYELGDINKGKEETV